MFVTTIAMALDTNDADEAQDIAQRLLRIKQADGTWSINGVALRAVSVAEPTRCRPDIAPKHFVTNALVDACTRLREMVVQCDDEEISPYLRADITSVLNELDAREHVRNAWSSQHSAMADKHAKAVREHVVVMGAEQSSSGGDNADR